MLLVLAEPVHARPLSVVIRTKISGLLMLQMRTATVATEEGEARAWEMPRVEDGHREDRRHEWALGNLGIMAHSFFAPSHLHFVVRLPNSSDWENSQVRG